MAVKNIIYLTSINEIADFDLWDNLFNNSSDEKKILIQKLKRLEDKKRSVLGESLLKYALKKNSIINYKIERTIYGKPFLSNSNFKFNISHSGDWVVLAFSEFNVGIDIQKKCENINYKRIAKRFFSKSEYEFLNHYNCENDKTSFFYLLWTLKESYAKMLGTGLRTPFNSFSVVEDNTIKNQIKIEKTDRTCCLKSIEILEGYALSICSENIDFNSAYEFVSLDKLKVNL